MKKIVLGALASLLMAGGVSAADLPYPSVAPSVTAQSPWQVRFRAIAVAPDEEAAVSTGTPLVLAAGAGVNVATSIVPELDITYYFTKNIAAELILATSPHRAWGEGTIAALGKLGSAMALPPTLLLQYHFTDFGAFKPYVGAGINYTFFYNHSDFGMTNFSLDNNVGWALQIGFDYMIDQHWGFNFDVKKIFLKTTATGTIAGPTAVSADIDLDPWVIGAGITYRF